MLRRLIHILIGRPLATSHLSLIRLALPLALVVVAADPLSSVAYGPEEIVRVLAGTGEKEFGYVVFIALAIALLMLVVVTSYSQAIRAYHGEGGAYVVAKENMGISFGLVGAAGLLLDYILTVSVSITAGVAALGSAFPGLANHDSLVETPV